MCLFNYSLPAQETEGFDMLNLVSKYDNALGKFSWKKLLFFGTLVSRSHPSGPLCIWQCFRSVCGALKRYVSIFHTRRQGADEAWVVRTGQLMRNTVLHSCLRSLGQLGVAVELCLAAVWSVKVNVFRTKRKKVQEWDMRSILQMLIHFSISVIVMLPNAINKAFSQKL